MFVCICVVAEVLIYQNKHVVLYKFNSDVFYYVIAGVECNELIMEQVLSALDESLNSLLRCAHEFLRSLSVLY